MRGRFVFIQFLFCWFCKLGISQIAPKDHPSLVKGLAKVYGDVEFQKEQNLIANAAWNRDNFSSAIELGRVYFTLENSPLRLGSTFTKSKESNSILPIGSMIWILGMDRCYDSLIIRDSLFAYFPYYQVYIPSIKKIAVVNGKYLPDFTISTRGYTDLDTLKPQGVSYFQNYHSKFKDVTKINKDRFYDDTVVDVQSYIENWIHYNDRVFQVFVRKQSDTNGTLIYIQTGTITPKNAFVVNVQTATQYLESTILPWIHGSRGLMGVRNVIEIEHWADACGEEGGSTYFTYIENAEPSGSLYKLGDFHCTSDAGVYVSEEILIFPSDTMIRYGFLNSQTPIIGVDNYLIQRNETIENLDDEWELEGDVISADGTSMFPHVKSNAEIQYSKWNRHPENFNKIKIIRQPE